MDRGSKANCRVYISRPQLLSLRHETPSLIAKQTLRNDSSLTGEILSTIKGHGIEFTDIRPYQPGDEVRHIDWRTTARTGNPYTREYNEERQQTVYLGVDQRINMFFGSELEFKSYTCARMAGSIAWGSVARGFRLGGSVVREHEINESHQQISDNVPGITDARTRYSVDHYNTCSVRTGPSKQTALKLINELALANNALSVHCPVNNEDATGLGNLLTRTLTHRPSGSTVYLISDFHGFNPDCAKLLTAIGKSSRVIMIRISDPLEEQLPDAGSVGISNGKQHKIIRLNRDKIEEQHQQRLTINTALQQCADSISGSSLHHVSTSASNKPVTKQTVSH